MGNRFNYCCPQCGSADAIDICAFVSIDLTAEGAEIAEEVQDIDGSCWSAENAAGCGLRLRGRGQEFFSIAAGRGLNQ
jgi:hypothetical protein